MIWRWLELADNTIGVGEHMAMDEALLESFIAGESLPTVRLYRWSEPCVTIGRNQTYEEARAPYPGLNVYKRPTGGRAVVHGDDLTVTVIASEIELRKNNVKRGILASYHRIVTGIIDTMFENGVQATSGLARNGNSSVDCFASVGKCDIVDLTTGLKIVGCAQFRSRGAILQQMSIRQHERYHIHEAKFRNTLKERLAHNLAVDTWEQSETALPGEYLRSRSLLTSQAKGADIGTKNSNV